MSYFGTESLIVLESSLDTLPKLVTLVLRGKVAIGGSGGKGDLSVETELKFNRYGACGDGLIFRRRCPVPVRGDPTTVQASSSDMNFFGGVARSRNL